MESSEVSKVKVFATQNPSNERALFKLLTKHFTILELQNMLINESYDVQINGFQ